MHMLVFLRHGESTWNLENRFAGWIDVPLTEAGVAQARSAGKLLREGGFDFDIAYTSLLKRAIWTTWHCLDEMESTWLPVVKDWRLNERHYGALQGLNKAQLAREYGNEQVMVWRRSFSARPPALAPGDQRVQRADRRYASVAPARIPVTESLEDTVERVIPLWSEVIAPAVRAGKRAVIVAHGNSIRALIKYLDCTSDTEIAEVNVPNGIPLVYELDAQLTPLGRYYLGDPVAAAEAAAAVMNQSKV